MRPGLRSACMPAKPDVEGRATIVRNDCGVLTGYVTETVAATGHSVAIVRIAMADDRRYRFRISLSYSYGDFGFAPAANAESFPTYALALDAGLNALLLRWHKPLAGDPASVGEELRMLRDQIVARLRQPTLF